MRFVFLHRMERPHLSKAAIQNITDLIEHHRARRKSESWFARFAERLTDWFGTASFLAVHILWFVIWVCANSGIGPIHWKFDPYPFQFLTFVVSLEAIVLSIMVLMVQNRIQKDADRRAELDLHINMLDEQETTLILRKLVRIEKSMKLSVEAEEEKVTLDLIENTDIRELERRLEEAEKERG